MYVVVALRNLFYLRALGHSFLHTIPIASQKPACVHLGFDVSFVAVVVFVAIVVIMLASSLLHIGRGRRRRRRRRYHHHSQHQNHHLLSAISWSLLSWMLHEVRGLRREKVSTWAQGQR